MSIILGNIEDQGMPNLSNKSYEEEFNIGNWFGRFSTMKIWLYVFLKKIY